MSEWNPIGQIVMEFFYFCPDFCFMNIIIKNNICTCIVNYFKKIAEYLSTTCF